MGNLLNLPEEVLDLLGKQQAEHYRDLEKSMREWAEKLRDDEELYIFEVRENPKLIFDKTEMEIEMSIGYEPVYVPRGQDIGYWAFVHFWGKNACIVHGPITKDML